jgi:DNA-binding SARP family transcriptional activator
MITVRVLGPVEISVAGETAAPELLWRKNLALLVYLARSPKLTRSRDHLVGLLWGDKPEPAARHSLNEAVRVLRKYLGPTALESEGDQVRLSPGTVELDVDRFEELTDDGNWEDAANLAIGDFMEGFAVPGCSELEDWLHAERFRLRQLSVDALVNRADDLLDAGRIRESAAAARRALSFDSTSDAAARTAMRSLAIAGDRTGALAVFESLVRRLDEELEVEPDEETMELAERVRHERTWKLPERWAAGEPAGAETRRSPLVGREGELEQLISAWSSCLADRHATLGLIEGDPGTGRTRLAEELLARARLDGGAVATARAVEADLDEAWNGAFALAQGVPLDAPWLEDVTPAAIATLARRLPGWAERFDVEKTDESMSPGRAFIDVARALASRQPILLFVDDAGWLDRDSLLGLGAVLRDLASTPTFVMVSAATYPERPEIAELRARVGRDLSGVSLRLGPLPNRALRQLARWALPSYDDVELDRVTRRVATDSAGLPTLAVELLHAVALGLDLGAASGAWPEPLRTLDQSLPGELPDGVAAAVRVGFRRLSPNGQNVLAAAAVIDEPVTFASLGNATGLDPAALGPALDELEWQRWLSADARGYSFVARIVRSVVGRDMLTAGQRRRIIEAVK